MLIHTESGVSGVTGLAGPGGSAGVGAAHPALMLDAALDSIPYGFCVWDSSFRLLMWNRHYLDIYGFPAERIHRGASLEDVVVLSAALGNHPDQTPAEFLAAYRAELLGNRSGARARSRETLTVGRTIERAHVFTPGLGWVVTHEDITEELALSETAQLRRRELERQNLRLDAAVNNIGQGLAMFDAGGRLVISNTPFQRIYALPDRLTEPGVDGDDIIRHLFAAGLRAKTVVDSPVELTCEQYLAEYRRLATQRRHGKVFVELGGRNIVVRHHPMDDGGWVATYEDVTEQRETEARLRRLARHDALTDLPNRISFIETLSGGEAGMAKGERAAVLAININRFRAINDTFGHAVGDGVLQQVAQRLGRLAGPRETLARLGGDAFALLLRGLSGPIEAVETAERIIGALGGTFVIGEQSLQLDASVGIALSPGDGVTAEDLMTHADLALDRARSEGRSSYHLFEPEMDAQLHRRRQLETGLRQALVRNQLQLAFQPLVALGRDEIVSFEALLRWTHPERGAVAPADFVPVAEQTGLIVPIGEWVLREACRQATQWPETIRVAVNLSPVQFKVRGLAGIVAAALREAGLAPERLELEITESLLLDESAETLATLHRLRQMGVRIAMDDFGTGYSSLSYLRSFPFDKIKIDRSFMRDIGTPEGLTIVRAVIGLGHALGMSTTAEGVETEAQLDLLRREGCDEVQGFYFSRPVSAAAATALLAKGATADRPHGT